MLSLVSIVFFIDLIKPSTFWCFQFNRLLKISENPDLKIAKSQIFEKLIPVADL